MFQNTLDNQQLNIVFSRYPSQCKVVHCLFFNIRFTCLKLQWNPIDTVTVGSKDLALITEKPN